MRWCFSGLILCLFKYQTHGEQCSVRSRKFGDTNIVFGENEITEEDAIVLDRQRRSFYRDGATLGRETSETLDYLLSESGYNRRLRPVNNGGPVQVNVNMAIRSMGPVDDNKEAYSLDCYFRQSWFDKRLSFNTSGLNELVLNWAFLAKIWVPDTFFVNGKKSFLHKITVPNRFVRIAPNGLINYSQRLTLWASCPMDLRKFPLDSHICNLEIGSFGYTAQDVIYKWQSKPFSVGEDVALAQFLLANASVGENIGISGRRDRNGFRNDSSVFLNFTFERQTGFFLLQIYTPLTLIVFCSWVSFWLVKTDKGGEVPARTALGATTVLSIVNLGFGGKSKPKVGYATAMDVYIIICFVAVFAALVEFACINFIDTFIKRFKLWEEEEKKRLENEVLEMSEKKLELFAQQNSNGNLKENLLENNHNHSEETEELVIVIPVDSNPSVRKYESSEINVAAPTAKSECVSTISTQDACVSTEDDDFEDIEEEEEDAEVEVEAKQPHLEFITKALDNFFDIFLKKIFRKYSPLIPQMTIYKETLSVIYQIDNFARKLFPLVFLCLQIMYWTAYLYLL